MCQVGRGASQSQPYLEVGPAEATNRYFPVAPRGEGATSGAPEGATSGNLYGGGRKAMMAPPNSRSSVAGRQSQYSAPLTRGARVPRLPCGGILNLELSYRAVKTPAQKRSLKPNLWSNNPRIWRISLERFFHLIGQCFARLHPCLGFH